MSCCLVKRSTWSASYLAVAILIAPVSQAKTILDFLTNHEGFTSQDANGTVSQSSEAGDGSLRLSNPPDWRWRAKRTFTRTGSELAKYHAFANEIAAAGVNGGVLEFDLILRKTTAIIGKTSAFWGTQYNLAINQTAPSGSGWLQKTFLELPASSFPTNQDIVSYPIRLTLRPWSETTSELRINPAGTWFEVLFGSNFGGATNIEWHIDNLRVGSDPVTPSEPTTIQLEAEKGTLSGVTAATTASGYSGSGYVTGFDAIGDKVAWSFPAVAGAYQLFIRYRSPFGGKSFNGNLNGAGFSGTFVGSNAFSTYDAGLVELANGTNTLDIGGGWNYYEIDAITLSPSTPLPPLPVPAIPCDPLATTAARNLLKTVTANYGSLTLSGQHELSDVSHVLSVSGKLPAIIEGDFMDYSPSRVQFGANPGNYTDTILAKSQSGQLIKFSWHWNAPTGLLNTTERPWWSGFYTDASTFNVATALANPQGAEYALILRDIDAIAEQLKKASRSNIPILWRPLHESEGAWFWWGAQGPGPFKQLWRLLYSRLTSHHGLHNLIWVLTSEDPDWYPGHDVVDVVGVDAYPDNRSDALSSRWAPLLKRFDGIKPLALTEFGGVPDIERMHRLGVTWAWFCSWSGANGPTIETNEKVARIYQSMDVVALDELVIPNRAPVFAGDRLLKLAAAADEFYSGQSLAADASDPDPADALAFSRISGPTWLVIASDGRLSGRPGLADGGPNEFVIRVTDSGGLFHQALLVLDVSTTPYQAWCLAEFGASASDPTLAGDSADPDSDGLSNLMEYAMATKPNTGNPVNMTGGVIHLDGARFLSLTVIRNPLATDLTYHVEVTDDLSKPGAWNSLETLVLTDTPEKLVVRDTRVGAHRFIRLRVVSGG